ncbi:MAG: hypothetical protein ISR96_11280 [Nitrospira sp.]|nr:hypothetical protein [Candidatus Brocadiales bacterium]MBL7050088.1 hypothetical protein [Nitrospira sp.]
MKLDSIKVLLIDENSKDCEAFARSLKALIPSSSFIASANINYALELVSLSQLDIVFASELIVKVDRKFFTKLFDNGLKAKVIIVKEIGAGTCKNQGDYKYAAGCIVKGRGMKMALKKILDNLDNLNAAGAAHVCEEYELQSQLFQQIHKSQKWWQNIIDAITDYLFVIDRNYSILRTNKSFANLFQKEPADIIMVPYFKLFGIEKPHDWCVVPEPGSVLRPGSVEKEINDNLYLISYFPIFFDESESVVYIIKDITENRRLKDQVYHLDKLSSLGTLTSGVAHEINNPLTGIIGYTEMLLMRPLDDTMKEYLSKVYQSAIRCKKIVANMLTFSRQTPHQKSIENLNEIIDSTIDIHEYWLKSANVEVVKDYGKIPAIALDRQQVQQVILNLIINAEHAISDTLRKGSITFITGIDETSDYIFIKVIDNGKGISSDVMQKVFDPFFTTKPVNVGTGLGLSIAHGIIAELGGAMHVESIEGESTTFTITLPVSQDKAIT